jgi:hypothetical protein
LIEQPGNAEIPPEILNQVSVTLGSLSGQLLQPAVVFGILLGSPLAVAKSAVTLPGVPTEH